MMLTPTKTLSLKNWGKVSATAGLFASVFLVLTAAIMAIGFRAVVRPGSIDPSAGVLKVFAVPGIVVGTAFLLYHLSASNWRFLAYFGAGFLVVDNILALFSIGVFFMPFTATILIAAHGLTDKGKRWHYFFYPFIFVFLFYGLGWVVDAIEQLLHVKDSPVILWSTLAVAALILIALDAKSSLKKNIIMFCLFLLLLVQVAMIGWLIWFRLAHGVWWLL